MHLTPAHGPLSPLPFSLSLSLSLSLTHTHTHTHTPHSLQLTRARRHVVVFGEASALATELPWAGICAAARVCGSTGGRIRAGGRVRAGAARVDSGVRASGEWDGREEGGLGDGRGGRD